KGAARATRAGKATVTEPKKTTRTSLSGTEAASTRRCGRGNKITNHDVQSCHISTGAAGCTSVDSGAGPVRGTERTWTTRYSVEEPARTRSRAHVLTAPRSSPYIGPPLAPYSSRRG